MKKIVILLLVVIGLAIQPVLAQHVLRGTIVHQDKGIPHVSILVKGLAGVQYSDSLGKFSLNLKEGEHQITFRHIAYQNKTLAIRVPQTNALLVEFEENYNQLDKIEINTGYQTLPKERATGAFTVVSKEQLAQRVSPNIIERLANNVPGLSFNKVGNSSASLNISIRGQSTLNANKDPLVVLDNFPYEGDVNAINPEDIESISILKDAAAASIWGSRAANGVIVLTSKKGKFNQNTLINFTNNTRLSEKPDEFYNRVLSVSDYIDIQTKLFKQGYYNSLEQNDLNNRSHTALPPLVEILIRQRDNKINESEALNEISSLKQNDVRNDINRYLNRSGLNQQYALNIAGGSTYHNYYISGGYDQIRGTQHGNDNSRLSFQSNQALSLLKQKLNLNVNIFYTQYRIDNNSIDYTYKDPYVMLADASGNPLAVPTLRNSFLSYATEKGLLNWEHKPLVENKYRNNETLTEELRFDLGLGFQLLPTLKISGNYQYGLGDTDNKNVYNQESFYVRNLVNTYTQLNPDGSLTRPIPYGGIRMYSRDENTSHNFRTQLSYNEIWRQNHQLTAIAGYEIKKSDIIRAGYGLYGFDEGHAASSVVDFVTQFASFSTPASRISIQNFDSNQDLANRFLSYYANMAYSYKNRYILSGSARYDQSNLFGVRTNQKGVPLYSVGLSWKVSDEPFFNSKIVNDLKIRLTYGYNGNIDRSLSGYTTASYSAANTSGFNNLTQQPYARIQNPPNPDLRWERVRTTNIGVDFGLLKGRISGSIDGFLKQGIDLIGNTPFPPSTGIVNFKGNYANTKGQGIDVSLNSQNTQGIVVWSTNLIFAYVNDKVVNFKTKGTNSNYLSNSSYPLVGRPIYGVYSYEWAGLDKATGAPMGILNGLPSMDYPKIISSYSPESLIYHGSARPTHFGAIGNTIAYSGLSLSFNVSYRFNYFYRRKSIVYGPTFGLDNSNADYSLRWQKPGDELITQVPSVPLTNNANRDNLYNLSSTLVEKGDQIRLEDINLSYRIKPSFLKKIDLRQCGIFLNCNPNLLLFSADRNIDPDYYNGYYGPNKSIALGVKIGL